VKGGVRRDRREGGVWGGVYAGRWLFFVHFWFSDAVCVGHFVARPDPTGFFVFAQAMLMYICVV